MKVIENIIVWRTPVGRIMNRFAKDVGVIDEMVPMTSYIAISVRDAFFFYPILKDTNYLL